jgi:hypothetical protein
MEAAEIPPVADDAVRRYVIALAEYRDAKDAMLRAEAAMGRETRVARRQLLRMDHSPHRVDLITGREFWIAPAIYGDELVVMEIR